MLFYEAWILLTEHKSRVGDCSLARFARVSDAFMVPKGEKKYIVRHTAREGKWVPGGPKLDFYGGNGDPLGKMAFFICLCPEGGLICAQSPSLA